MKRIITRPTRTSEVPFEDAKRLNRNRVAREEAENKSSIKARLISDVGKQTPPSRGFPLGEKIVVSSGPESEKRRVFTKKARRLATSHSGAGHFVHRENTRPWIEVADAHRWAMYGRVPMPKLRDIVDAVDELKVRKRMKSPQIAREFGVFNYPYHWVSQVLFLRCLSDEVWALIDKSEQASKRIGPETIYVKLSKLSRDQQLKVMRTLLP